MLELRDYQSEAVEFLVPRKRAFVQAPAGSGKTLIAAHAISRVVKPGQRVLWLGNTLEQVQQGIDAIQKTGGPEGVDFECCCVASQPDTQSFDVVLFDECHHLPAETWRALTEKVKPSCILWGMTATPWHPEEERNECVRDIFKEWFVVERKRVEESGHITKGKVYVHDLDEPGQFDREIDARVSVELINRCRRFPGVPKFEHERRIKYQITQEYIQANEARNHCAVSMAVRESDLGQSVLMLVFSIEHGERLALQISSTCALVHSKLGKKKRATLIDEFRSGERKVLVATSLADEGLDVVIASRLILVAGGRSAGKLEQRVGRILRPAAGKEVGICHDFLDRGACFALAQANARFKVYQRLGYSPEIVSYGRG
jgi:superfamily II DNA or RNA helicase